MHTQGRSVLRWLVAARRKQIELADTGSRSDRAFTQSGYSSTLSGQEQQRQLPRLWRRTERGATLVETAVVFPIVALLIFGIAEFSLALKDYLSIGHASREGARVAATLGADVQADFAALEALVSALAGADMVDVTSITIRNPDNFGETTSYTYSPGGTCDWIPCPDFFAGGSPGAAPYVQPGYKPTDRDVSAPTTGRVEVRITFDHRWITGFFGSTSSWTSSTIMRLEPSIFE